MREPKAQKSERPETLSRAEKFIDEGEHEKALNLLKIYEEKGETSLSDILSCNLLKCELFFQQGLYEDVVKLAEHTYKESLSLGTTLLSVDALIIMIKALNYLYELEKAGIIIKQAEHLLKQLTDLLPKDYQQRKASIAYNKGLNYERDIEFDLAAEYFKKSLILQEKFGPEKEVAISLIWLGFVVGVDKGELNRGLEYVKQGLAIATENKLKLYIAEALNVMACIYDFKGKINHGIKYFEQSFEIFKKLQNKARMAIILNNLADAYRMKGELDHALECLEECLALFDELGFLRRFLTIHDFLIQILLEKGDLEQAQQHLHRMEQTKNQWNDKNFNIIYLFDNALILKALPQAYNHEKAEELLKQILAEEEVTYEFTIRTLLTLCDLLLIKLSNMTNLKVLDEILFYVNQIKDIAKNSESHWLLAETYFLQAELELLTLDFETAKESLMEAQIIAKQHELDHLNERILREQAKLHDQTSKWVSLKNSTETIIELSNLTTLKEQIKYMLKKRQILKKF